jgi:hypothetical protein
MQEEGEADDEPMAEENATSPADQSGQSRAEAANRIGAERRPHKMRRARSDR